ncbi:MAG: isocitrate/isopropylmalate dehydrogenase family protein [Eubacteriales bacterium]|nr:isocitrate/isopropylmalate dehydrogenase family protein [Christensenellaceae bacterium]MEA5067274.1 isocitrate/isopropylmalate dehydrogenase family protein [Eubacteriales bacterium]
MTHRAVLVPGDGIGPEIARATCRVIEKAGAEIEWQVCEAGEAMIAVHGAALPPDTIAAIRATGVALKGPITTPIGVGFRSVNVIMRKELDLYANVRPARSWPGVKTRFEGVDLVVVRENTEDLYAGVEHMVGEDAAESIKIITRKGSERIVRYAFEYARANGRKRVTAVHKANIMKCTDGLFLRVAREVASQYPEIAFDDMIIDALCMRLVQIPEAFDVLVMPNLYGDIVSDLAAGLVGGPGLAPSANVGQGIAIFEAVHGSAPQLTDTDTANPAALMLSAVMMLKHLGEADAARRMQGAIESCLMGGRQVTRDLGGTLGTRAFADAIIARM